ncbi:hypothetical protein TMM008_14670 [Pseudomonas sp. 008]|nr:hypothetical protein TMM008_14670 [Pseudomonas sp. 008]
MAGDWWPRITPFPVPEPWKAGIKSRLSVQLSRFDKRLAKKLSASDVSQFWFRNCGEGACPRRVAKRPKNLPTRRIRYTEWADFTTASQPNGGKPPRHRIDA